MEIESSGDEAPPIVQEKAESSDFESFSEDSDDPSQNVVTQRDVFGSDTDSEGGRVKVQVQPRRSSQAEPVNPVDANESSEDDIDSPVAPGPTNGKHSRRQSVAEPAEPTSPQASSLSSDAEQHSPSPELADQEEPRVHRRASVTTAAVAAALDDSKEDTDGENATAEEEEASDGASDDETPAAPTPQPGPSRRRRTVLDEDDDDEDEEVSVPEKKKKNDSSPKRSGAPRSDRVHSDEDGGDDDDDDVLGLGDDRQENSGPEEDGDDDEEEGVPDETRIAVDFPLIRADLGREMHLVKMPNFLSVETRPFDPNFYEDELDEDEVMDEEGRTRLKLKEGSEASKKEPSRFPGSVENTIRWRVANTPEGELVHESNARFVRWSDGSLSLHLGDEIFDIHKVDIHSDYNYLFIREGSGLQGQSSLRTKLTFRPHSTDSFTHRKITLSLADKTNKSQKVKILPMAGADPETNRMVLVRKEEEKLRATLRRESQLRRMRERQAMSRSSFGSHSGADRRRSSQANWEEEDDDEEDDGNTTSLNALKRNAKNALASSRRDVAAIYSSESDASSDISEPRKKVRARISDDEAEEVI